MIIISSSVVLSDASDTDANNPVLLWENLVTTGNVVAFDKATGTSVVENPNYPTINLANPSTGGKNYFLQDTAGESIFFEVQLDGSQQIDGLGVAGHNFGSLQRIVQVFAATTGSPGSYSYSAVTSDYILENDQPVMFRFVKQFYVAVKIVITNTQSPGDYVRAAVLYVGELTIFERKVQASFTPIVYGRMREVTSGRSETGQFLGRNVIGEMVESSCNLAYMTGDWYRAELDPFVDASATVPFFFAWAPETYPFEVGYAWLTDDAIPQIHEPYPELMRITFNMQGIVS